MKFDGSIRAICNIHPEKTPGNSQVLHLIFLHQSLFDFDNIRVPFSNNQQIVYIQDKIDHSLILLHNEDSMVRSASDKLETNQGSLDVLVPLVRRLFQSVECFLEKIDPFRMIRILISFWLFDVY